MARPSYYHDMPLLCVYGQDQLPYYHDMPLSLVPLSELLLGVFPLHAALSL